jgi:hypothetical protein
MKLTPEQRLPPYIAAKAANKYGGWVHPVPRGYEDPQALDDWRRAATRDPGVLAAWAQELDSETLWAACFGDVEMPDDGTVVRITARGESSLAGAPRSLRLILKLYMTSYRYTRRDNVHHYLWCDHLLFGWRAKSVVLNPLRGRPGVSIFPSDLSDYIG